MKRTYQIHSTDDTFIRCVRVLFATVYLIYIILTIPLSFEVGGLNCGLSYSLTILILYFGLATFRMLKYNRFISSFLYYLQHLLLPTLLSFFLTVFNNGDEKIVINDSFLKNIWWTYIIQFWKIFLINSTPLFTILEGFCSLLSIQAIGQLFQYFVKNKSDTWSILNLILSSCILSTSFYFVGKIYVSPLIDLENVGLVSASLLGSVFTLTILITFYAIYFNRATTLESSLMVAYIIKCCYELFPELSNDNISSLFKFVFNEFKKIDNQAKGLNLNNENIIIIKLNHYLEYYKINYFFQNLKDSWIDKLISNKNSKIVLFFNKFNQISEDLINFLFEHFPNSFDPLWDFFKISINNLTFSILTQLAFRILVFFAATKIIPILSSINKNNVNEKPQQSPSSRLIYLYSPCIIIAVYTNLMIQYNYEIDKETHLYLWLHNKFVELFSNETNNNSSSSIMPIHTWQFWNWINIFAVLLLYFSELFSYDPEDSALTDNWN